VREKSFTYKFERDGREVRFAMAMPYMESHWKDFLSRHKGNPYLETGVLTKSGKGRDVELAKVRKPGAEPAHRVLLTSRHHACESMATYSLEGILEEALSGKEDGGWLREHVEILAIPFVDKDGVEDGDQGKNRRPRDHNRDYDGTSVHASVRAIRQLVPQWSGGKLHLALDMHCPHIRGENNEEIYFVGGQDAAMWARVERFAGLLEKSQTGPLVFRSTNNIPFGKAWNTAANFAAGKSCSRWASELPGIRVATGIEIPYANAGGKAVTAETARALGADLARAIRQVLE
jgi:predicted deacylase